MWVHVRERKRAKVGAFNEESGQEFLHRRISRRPVRPNTYVIISVENSPFFLQKKLKDVAARAVEAVASAFVWSSVMFRLASSMSCAEEIVSVSDRVRRRKEEGQLRVAI